VEPTQTALIVAVPEAEEAVGRHRVALDPAAAWGVPAHVTILYPFVPPERVDGELLNALREVMRSVPPFEVTFARVEWFGDSVAWLAPDPDEPFRRLTAAVWRRFPDTPPYGGDITVPVPHLTIGQDAPRPVLAAAAAAVTAHLPIRATVSSVRLIAGAAEANAWQTVCELPL